MLPKNFRLKKNSEFTATFFQGRFVNSDLFTLNIGKDKTNQSYPCKVAFVVSKKIDKRAVVRNLIKRRMRAAYQEILKENNIDLTKWMSMIFIAKQPCLTSDYEKIFSQMKYIINKGLKKYV